MISLQSILTILLTAAFAVVPSSAIAGSPACDNRVNNTTEKLLECVTLEGVREHQAALQAIADANGGTRSLGTPGYDASVNYVVERMDAAGYEVTVQEFLVGSVVTANVLAESTNGDADNVVVVGAQLDSVPAGPGIQDNGSGSAAILEVAEMMAKVRPRNKVRFAWWGAEESGLAGSTYYLANLSQEDRDRVSLYLNFDMIGSPNFVRYIYTGIGVSCAAQGFFEGFYASGGLAYETITALDVTSAHLPFIAAGISAAGLFTGAEGIKTAEQAAIYGGTDGEQYDPCYHLACDTFDNISLEVLDQNADAVAAATLDQAMKKRP